MNEALDLIASDEAFDSFMKNAELTLLDIETKESERKSNNVVTNIRKERLHEKLSLKSIFKPTGTDTWTTV